jgi:hypothetical protein
LCRLESADTPDREDKQGGRGGGGDQRKKIFFSSDLFVLPFLPFLPVPFLEGALK